MADMFLAPEGIEQKIGLVRIRSRLKQMTRSAAAEEAVGLLKPSSNRKRVEHRLRIASELKTCLSGPDSIPFKSLDDLTPIVRAAKPMGSALPTDSILTVADAARTARLIQSFFGSRSEAYPTLAEVWGELAELRELERAVDDVFDADGQIKDHASPDLKRIRRSLHNTRDALRSRMSSILARTVSAGYAAEDQPTIRSGRMVIPITASAKRKVDGFVHDVSATGQTVYIEPRECLELNNDIRELEIAESREIERIRRLLTDQIRTDAELLTRNGELLVHLDVALAIAGLALELKAVVPQFNNEGVVRIVDGLNPELLLVYRGQNRGEDVVRLDIEIGESFHTLLISGPNAGGKSIAMKTVGLMVAMLGMGIPVPVSEESTFHLFGGILADIGDAQSVEDDLSTYSSHLRNLGSMLERASDDTLVLIDEAGTGTDPDEGGSLAQAVLERLTNLQARTIVTTHHGILKAWAHDAPNVANGSMSFDLSTLKPTFEFRLHVPGASYAAEIAMKVGLPEEVISRARELTGSDRMRMESLVVSLEASNRELDEKLLEAQRTVRDARLDREKLQERLENLQIERDAIQQSAVEEADRIIREANRTVERVVREIRESQADTERTKAARALLAGKKKELDEEGARLKKRTKTRGARDRSSSGGSNAGTVNPPARQTSSETLQVGDYVSLDGTGADGQILSLKGAEAVVRLGDLQTRVPVSRLTRRGGPPEQTVTVRHAQRGGERLAGLDVQRRIDVRGYRVDEALSTITSFIDEAYSASLDRVEILHGKGTGALRHAIQEYLEASDVVSRLEEAPWNEGGAGITVAWLNE